MSNPTPPSPAFIVSLRNDTGGGVPGHDFGPAKYMLQVRPNPPSGSPDPTDPNTYLLTDDVGSQKWVSKLAGTAANGPIIIFIHGFDNLAPAVVTRYIAVQSGMVNAGGKVTLLCFDWPTSGVAKYKSDQDKAVESGNQLITTCINVLDGAGVSLDNVHILTHSMGGYVLQNAFDSTTSAPKVGQVLMAEADVQELAFDVADNSPATSALACFMPCVTHLTVYWSSDDAALKAAKIFNRFVGPCGASSPATAPDATRLGLKGLSSATLASPSYSAKLSNVGFVEYYEAMYVNTSPPPDPKPNAQDSHVWPILGTRANQESSGDPHFMTDVWEVVNGVTPYTRRNPSTTNNWTFTT